MGRLKNRQSQLRLERSLTDAPFTRLINDMNGRFIDMWERLTWQFVIGGEFDFLL
jgi:hypothetical protein